MSQRRVGLWLIGAVGGVCSTAVLGLSALSRRLTDTTSLVTSTPLFDGLDLDDFDQFVIGGHDIRKSNYVEAVRDLNQRSNVFNEALIQACKPDLDKWSANVRPGTVLGSGPTIAKLADLPEVQPRQHAEGSDRIAIQADLKEFRERNKLDQLVVANVSSTEPPRALDDRFQQHRRSSRARPWTIRRMPRSRQPPFMAGPRSISACRTSTSRTIAGGVLPCGFWSWQRSRRASVSGKDGKTGETLMKTVLAPMFLHRNFKILSWVGHNIFGNRDGVVLDDPTNKASKIQTKDQVISSIVGYKPQTHVSIEYIESLDDWKTAWDHIHFQGFLGTKMILQFLWQGCDSLLAAPLLLDIVRLTLLAQRRGESGVLKHLACFFKSPMGCDEHDFFKQMEMLAAYTKSAR